MQKLMKIVHKHEKGFTLVELMIVVIIIGILVAIALPIYNQVTENARRSACQANLRILDGAIMQVFAEDSSWPEGQADLIGYVDGADQLTCPNDNKAYTWFPGPPASIRCEEVDHNYRNIP